MELEQLLGLAPFVFAFLDFLMLSTGAPAKRCKPTLRWKESAAKHPEARKNAKWDQN